jgi:hypothetical protein
MPEVVAFVESRTTGRFPVGGFINDFALMRVGRRNGTGYLLPSGAGIVSGSDDDIGMRAAGQYQYKKVHADIHE